jgi:hypothetical protein
VTHSAVHIRPDLGMTLADLDERLVDQLADQRSEDVPVDSIKLDLTGPEPGISWRGHELPATPEGVLAFGTHLQVPSAFLKRIKTPLRQVVLTDLLSEHEEPAVRITWDGAGIQRVVDVDQAEIPPLGLVRAVGTVLGTKDAQIVRLVDQPDAFSFDVRVPETHRRGLGGDPSSLVPAPDDASRRVGDITAGGLRVSLNRKRNLSPSAQPFAQRLACTNGMEFQDLGLKLDARGSSAEEVLAEFEALAERAFSRVEDLIAAFYELRDNRVDNPERMLHALATEQRIPARSLDLLLAAAPALDDPTEFDVINLVTNMANSPDLTNEGGRVLLERAGGAFVAEHAARCERCQQKLRA